jgi:hypothetical protein
MSGMEDVMETSDIWLFIFRKVTRKRGKNKEEKRGLGDRSDTNRI